MRAGDRRWRLQQALTEPGSDQRARVFDAGPLHWAWGEHAWEQAGIWAESLGGAVLLIGEASWLKAWRKPLTQAFLERGLATRLRALPDGVECCESVAKGLAVEAESVACIVAVGGGKVMDLGKWAGALAGKPVITLPSSAATCACATAVVVMHSEQGEYLDVLSLDSAPYGCAVDSALIAAAPANLLAAGLADSLAKAFEWQAVGVDLGQPGAASAWELAQGMAQRLVELGAKAVAGDRQARMACIEIILLQSALISCLGDAPAAAAHSFANALSVEPAAKGVLHGQAVAWGLLFQSWLKGRLGQGLRQQEFDLPVILASWGLPTRLPKASLGPSSKVAQKLMHPDETLWLIPGTQGLSLALVEEGLHSLLDGGILEK